MSIVFHASRKDLVRSIARDAFNAGDLNLMNYADRIQELYFTLIPPASQDTNLRQPCDDATGERFEADRRHNRQIVERWVKGRVAEFPDDLEEPWVMALPDQWRDKALTELSARYGLLPAPIPSGGHTAAWTGDIMQSMADVLRDFAPIAEDGVINHLDADDLPAFILSSAKAMGILSSMQRQASEALQEAERRKAR
ncbi:hypothetical protein [Frateuria aurantia]|nr:hypothetical protein [Frateuria aurantia]